MYSPPFPLMLTYGPKHENFKADAADLDIDRFHYEWYRWASNGPNNGKNRLHCQKSKLRFFLHGLRRTDGELSGGVRAALMSQK